MTDTERDELTHLLGNLLARAAGIKLILTGTLSHLDDLVANVAAIGDRMDGWRG